MRTLALVMIAGAVGSGLRYVGTTALNRPEGLPWGTLAVNLLGAFLIGGVVMWAHAGGNLSRQTLVMVTAGFLGGLTTFSSFALEGQQLWVRRGPVTALTYVVGSVVLGMAAAWGGARVARMWSD